METHLGFLEQAFAGSQKKFEALRERLGTGEVLDMPHGDVERLIEEDGREIERQLLEDHLALRAAKEVKGPVLGSDGILRTHHRQHARELETIFGTVPFTRLGHGARGSTSLHPLDAALNLPVERYSHGVQRRVAQEAPRDSFSATERAISTTTGAHVPQRQLEEIVGRVAVDFDAFYAARSVPPAPPSAPTAVPEASYPAQDEPSVVSPPSGQNEGSPGILALSVDGKGIVMRKQDLLGATRKAAEKRTHKMTKRLSRGEKRNAKRMATVAAVYGIAPFVRTPEEVAGTLHSGGTPKGETPKAPPRRRPRPVCKRVWASVEKSPAKVIGEVFEEALRRDPDHQQQWVALVDGNKTQIRLLKEQALSLGVALVIILDLIHVLEYLWKAAFVFNTEGTREAEAWVSERLLKILQGKSSLVAAGIRRSATKRGLSKKDRVPADKCASYLLKYREFLRYNQYLAAGFPIATGVIEGACRHLIKDRMDVTGARWSLRGAEAILKLRALHSSGDFDAYWRFHVEQELLRNYTTHYAEPIPFHRPSREGKPNPQPTPDGLAA